MLAPRHPLHHQRRVIVHLALPPLLLLLRRSLVSPPERECGRDLGLHAREGGEDVLLERARARAEVIAQLLHPDVEPLPPPVVRDEVRAAGDKVLGDEGLNPADEKGGAFDVQRPWEIFRHRLCWSFRNYGNRCPPVCTVILTHCGNMKKRGGIDLPTPAAFWFPDVFR